MTRDEIVQAILAMVTRIAAIAPPPLDADIYLAGFASLNALELLVEMEDTFGVSIVDEQFIAARTLNALADMVTALANTDPT